MNALDTVIDDALTAERIVGAVVLVLQDGETVYHRAAGFADREAAVPMRQDMIFRLASVTKPLVTAALLALAERGRLGLDDAVTDTLPDFRPALGDGTVPVITLRQLLTHTAGLSYGFLQPADGPYHQAGVSDGMDQPGLGMEEELRRIAAAGLAYPPGTGWGYSVALDVLGAVIGRVTGTRLPEAVADLVTGPLGLADTGFGAPDRARLVTPYADGRPPVRMGETEVVPFAGLAGLRFSPARAFDPASFPSGGAGMNGTAPDIARFLEAIRRGGGGVVSRETAAAMMTSQTGTLELAGRDPGWGFGFGGAVVLDSALARTPLTAGSWSWGGAYGHSWFVDPARALVAVALTNTAVEGVSGGFPAEIRAAVYQDTAR